MAYTKDSRLLMRMTEEMARRIRALAEIHQRSIQDEIRFIVSCGLEHLDHCEGKESLGFKRQLLSSGVNLRREKESAA